MKMSAALERLLTVWDCLILAWILDVASTFYGLSLGLREQSSLFLWCPFGWILLSFGLTGVLLSLHSGHKWVRDLLVTGFLGFSFVPAINNVLLIGQVLFP